MKITLLFLSVVFCCIAVELSHGWFSGRGGSSRSSSVSSRRSWSRPRSSIRRSWTRARTSVSRRRSWSRPSRRSWTRARTSVSRRRSWSRPSRRSWTRARTSVSRRRSWSRPSRRSWTRARTSVSRRRSWSRPSRRSWTRRRRTPIRIKTWRRGNIVKTWKNAVRKAKKTWKKVKNSRFGKKVQKYHKKFQKYHKKIQKYHKKFQKSKVGQFWKKYKKPIKLAKKILKGKYIGASLIGAEIAAEAYMKKYPNTKLTKALKKAKRFGKKNKVVKLLYDAAKKYLRKRELHDMIKNRSTRNAKKNGNSGSQNENDDKQSTDSKQNANDDVEADKAIPCELITYDVDKNGEVTVNEFRLYISKLGIKGDPSVLERIDANHDGEISKEELQNFQDEMEKRNYVVDCD